jgi:hypothetical protein
MLWLSLVVFFVWQITLASMKSSVRYLLLVTMSHHSRAAL